MLTIAIYAIVVSTAHAQPPAKQVTEEQDDAFAEEAADGAASYELSLQTDPERKLTFRQGALLHWTNPLGGRDTQGYVYLWTDRGRPQAAASIYQFNGDDGRVRLHHEFCSFAETGLTAIKDGRNFWAPKEAGVDFRPVPEAPAPADSPAARLRQMRDLGEKFTSDKTTRDGVQRTLRLLPRPVYRYEPGNPDVIDGGLFALVEATDPEAFLLMEAANTPAGAQWRFAATRMNSIPLRVLYEQAVVWEAPLLPWRDALNRTDKPYTVFQIK